MLRAHNVDKKTLAICILSLVIILLLVWIFGVTGPDNRELNQRLDSSLDRVNEIEESKGRLQATNKGLITELEKERTLRDELQKTSDGFEQLYQETRRHNQEQREIIDSITSGDIGIDDTIDRIEERLNRSLENLKRFKSGSD